MYKAIKELFHLLSPQQRSQYLKLQILVVLMAFLELVGVASIGPFMALVADISLLKTNPILHDLYVYSGLQNPMDFLFLAGVIVLLLLTTASVVSILTTWRLSMFSFRIGTQIADRLYRHYLYQDWLFHAAGSSAQLTKQIATECQRVTQFVINPLMQMNARLVLVCFLALAIILYNPSIALIGLLLFAGGYALIYRTIRRRLVTYGRQISRTNAQRYRLMNEGFGGIKDTLLLGRQQNFINQFHATGTTLANAQGKMRAFGQAPRYFMELLAFGAMVSLVLILLKTHQGALSQVLPILAVYALAGFKLLPALQQIYTSITQVRGNMASFESIKADLKASENTAQQIKQNNSAQQKPLINGAISLRNVSFQYPNKHQPALRGVNLTIPHNATVGLVGASGSGKSTAIDIILALIKPDSGELMVGDTIITPENRRQWQQQIGFVPQSIFLSEGSIAENIAFGLSTDQIDREKVKHAASLAHLDELIDSLPEGLDTIVGERGVQLSGGQRQRVGIARALYEDASVLVFDEATSALDGITENAIMTAIGELTGQKTIILIAHRLKTVQQCDILFMMERGKVIAQGTYESLLQSNTTFQKMSELA